MDRDTDMSGEDMDMVMVTLPEAAQLAQVSVRTIRRWIQHGHLPVTEGDDGKLVSPADLPLARERAGHGHRRGHEQPGRGRGHGHVPADRDTESVMAASQVQAIAFRDTFIQPLVDQLARQEEKLTAQAEQIGRLSSERDQLRAALEQVQAERAAEDAARGSQEPRDAPVAPAMGQEPPRGFWARLVARLRS